MLNYHNNTGPSLDPTSHNDELALVGYHFASIPWNPVSNAPACLPQWSAVSFIDWPPEKSIYITLLFLLILCLKVLDCIGKGSFKWLWSLLLYAALFAPILFVVSAYAISRDQCEPKAAAFVQNCERSGAIYPCTISALDGAWVSDAEIVWVSETCLFAALFLAMRLLFPAICGAHYLLVPHPAERFIQPGRGADQAVIDEAGFADSLGQTSIDRPPPDFVLRNKARRIRNVADLFRAEREAAEEAIKHERARRMTERKDQ
jgi:hypothetical protein